MRPGLFSSNVRRPVRLAPSAGVSGAPRRTLALLALAAAGAVLPIRPIEAQTHVLIVTGIGQEAQYVTRFRELGASLAESMHQRLSVPDSTIAWLGEDASWSGPRYRGASTADNIKRELDRIEQRVRPNDQVIVVLIGHGGSGEGPNSKFAIPGPDLTAEDYARLLDRFEKQRVAFINRSSASGDMLPVLSAPNRVVITATKTAFERNESQFARFFVEAFTKDVADADKDGRVSLLEAFAYASAETKRHYEDLSKIMTEHAQLDDDGDGRGAAAPTGRDGDGMLARRFFIGAGVVAAGAAANSPELVRLYEARFALEEQIDALKRRKADMSADAYDTELEKLLLELSRTSLEIRKLEGGG